MAGDVAPVLNACRQVKMTGSRYLSRSGIVPHSPNGDIESDHATEHAEGVLLYSKRTITSTLSAEISSSPHNDQAARFRGRLCGLWELRDQSFQGVTGDVVVDRVIPADLTLPGGDGGRLIGGLSGDVRDRPNSAVHLITGIIGGQS